ncbi:uncharacterized protein LOC128678304 [Plodia interpunctella]|uniref:uncharacterized protein LOC128678304 n=1 Tax=Plodia interpunctella TaxID=58824 RepID=UPI002368DAE3|nr:uncharacterized protein LOC128678304 [Plodia interpunctella]
MAKSFLLSLPPEVMSYIFIKLNKNELRNLMLTCKFLRKIIINDNTLWRSQQHHGLIIFNSFGNRKPDTITWYDRCRISYNWCNGIYQNKVLLHHYVNYMPWIKFHNSEILVVSFGSELHAYKSDRKGIPNCHKVAWKLKVPTVKRDDVRTNDVSRFVFKDQFLVCGNRDGCFALYHTNDIAKMPQFLCHVVDCHDNGLLEVTAVELINKTEGCPIVVSGSNYSPNLKLFSIKLDNNTQRSLDDEMGHIDCRNIEIENGRGVSCIQCNSMNDRLIVGLYENSKPILIDVNIGEVIMTQSESRNVVRDVQWHNENVIVYVTHSGSLQLIDTRTHEVIFHQLDPFQSTLYCVKSDGDRAVVVGSAEYSRCVLFDVRNMKHHQQIYFTQKKVSPIYSLDFDSTKLIAAADRSVAVLNFNETSYAEKRDYSQIFEFVNR